MNDLEQLDLGQSFENYLSMRFSSSRQINVLLHKLASGLTSERAAAIDAAVARRRNKTISIQPHDLNNQVNGYPKDLKVCLVTEEIANIGPSGGIGAAFAELVRLLASKPSVQVTLLYANHWAACSEKNRSMLFEFERDTGCSVEIISPSEFVNPDFKPQHISYAVMRWLQKAVQESSGRCWDFVHFHDYKGIGYFTAARNRQCPGSIAQKVVVQAHGPSRWAVEANDRFFSSEDQLIIDFMERKSLELCDQVISPSQYLIDWVKERKWQLAIDREEPTRILQNLRALTPTKKILENRRCDPLPLPNGVEEVVYFGRHESRKGLKVFLSAIGILDKTEAVGRLNVTILGGLGDIGETPSLLFLERATKNWKNVNLKLLVSLNRDHALHYLGQNSSSKLVCVCSKYENSPYTVVETAQLGCMLILSAEGGGKELLANKNFAGCIEMTSDNLVSAIKKAFKQPEKYIPSLANSDEQLQASWLEYHTLGKQYHDCKLRSQAESPNDSHLPLVTFVITHYNRPLKLLEAVRSVLLQTYPNIEIIVIDDGTADEDSLLYLRTNVEPLLTLARGRLIYRQNGYLGAARNTGLDNASGEYIIFMDDDDVAMPRLVSTLVEAVLNTHSDVIIPLNSYMPLHRRDVIRNARFNVVPLPSYVPIGNIASLTPLHNFLGACTSLISVLRLRDIGGYTPLRDVGHEDYECYVRLCRAGCALTILPEVLYLYETQRPSMLSNTTLWSNFRRSVKAHSLPEELEDLVLCIKGGDIEKMRKARMLHINADCPSLENLLRVWPSADESLHWMSRHLQENEPGSELLKGILRGFAESPKWISGTSRAH